MNSPLLEVFIYFFRLGCLGFGGPLALIGSMQADLVINRKWMDSDEFNASFSLIKAMPGPVAFQTAVFLGRQRAGFWGGFLGGFGVVFPAFVLMILFSMFFSSIADLSGTKSLMLGMQVAALGVILGSLKGLVKNNYKEIFFWILVILAGAINFKLPGLEPVIIISMGLFMVVKGKLREDKLMMMSLAPIFLWSDDIKNFALVCFKAGALVFGTGLAIVPMLQHDVVVKYHWLTQNEFLDALAFGQMTPGPVVVTATYIGHKLAGMPGAIIGTLCIFAAAFFHMSTWFPLVVKKMSRRMWISDFVYGAVAAVVGPIIVTVIKMGIAIDLNPFLLVMSVIIFILTLLNKVPLWILIPLGGVLNFLVVQFIH
jgi:chromate transporter